MEQNTASTDEPLDNKTDERDEVRNLARENGLYTLVFYGSEPSIAFVNRDKSPSTSHALPNEQIALVDWTSGDNWAVFTTTASDRQTNPQWETDTEPDQIFDTRTEAVQYAAEQLND